MWSNRVIARLIISSMLTTDNPLLAYGGVNLRPKHDLIDILAIAVRITKGSRFNKTVPSHQHTVLNAR